MALAFTACKPEVDCVTSNPYDMAVYGTCVFGDKPSWVTVGNLSLSQMAVMVDQYGVPAAVQENDLLAAFVGEECRGVVSAFKDAENKWRFNLVVFATSSDTDLSKLQFTLRYYSTAQGGTYTSQPIPYQDNAILGSNTEGFVPTWK